MNDIPYSVIEFLKENINDTMTWFTIKCKLMNELNLRGKEAKKYAKWYKRVYLNK